MFRLLAIRVLQLTIFYIEALPVAGQAKSFTEANTAIVTGASNEIARPIPDVLLSR
jgi:hypothetical protein